MTTPRLRWWLAILALALGASAAVVRAPRPVQARSLTIFKPPSGC